MYIHGGLKNDQYHGPIWEFLSINMGSHLGILIFWVHTTGSGPSGARLIVTLRGAPVLTRGAQLLGEFRLCLLQEACMSRGVHYPGHRILGLWGSKDLKWVYHFSQGRHKYRNQTTRITLTHVEVSNNQGHLMWTQKTWILCLLKIPKWDPKFVETAI